MTVVSFRSLSSKLYYLLSREFLLQHLQSTIHKQDTHSGQQQTITLAHTVMEPSLAGFQTFPVAHNHLASLIISQWYKLRDRITESQTGNRSRYIVHIIFTLSRPHRAVTLHCQKITSQVILHYKESPHNQIWSYTLIISATQEAEAG